MKTAVIVGTMKPRGRPGPCAGRTAFGAGLERHGWTVRHTMNYEPADMAVFWGVRERDSIEQQRRRGEVCILERGYVGDRFRYTSVSFGGGLNGRGVFRGPFDDSSRWRQLFGDMLQPWSERAGVALIMGQVQGDMSVRGVDLFAWYTRAIDAFTRIGLQTRYRAHPHRRADVRPLAHDLADAAVVVTYNSNSAVDAVLAGVPTVAVDAGSMAWAVTGHVLGELPPTPSRDAWAHALAWKQWTAEEMEAGECWDAVRPDHARG